MSFRVASRYAKSLIDLATEQGKLDRVLEDMTLLDRACQHRELALLLKSPIVKADKKGKVLHAIFSDKIDALSDAFIDILLRKGREPLLPEIAQEFIRQYRDINGISIVEVTSATPLSDEILEAIRRKLTESRLTHSKIEFRTKTDPALIGGFVIAFDDKLYDASVRHQLQQLRASFSSKEFQTAF
jgi:F-type H+-transporting ATPase subunit delta